MTTIDRQPVRKRTRLASRNEATYFFIRPGTSRSPTGRCVQRVATTQPTITPRITPINTQRSSGVNWVPKAGTKATAATTANRDVWIMPFASTADVA